MRRYIPALARPAIQRMCNEAIRASWARYIMWFAIAQFRMQWEFRVVCRLGLPHPYGESVHRELIPESHYNSYSLQVESSLDVDHTHLGKLT